MIFFFLVVKPVSYLIRHRIDMGLSLSKPYHDKMTNLPTFSDLGRV